MSREADSKLPSIGRQGDGENVQVQVLFSMAQSMLEEEFKRAERFDAKVRNVAGLVVAFFAFAQAATLAVLARDGLAEGSVRKLTSFAGVSSIVVAIAVALGIAAFMLRSEDAFGTGTLKAYRVAARDGNPAVSLNLIAATADIVDQRRAVNERRARMAELCVWASVIAVLIIGIQLFIAYRAVLGT